MFPGAFRQEKESYLRRTCVIEMQVHVFVQSIFEERSERFADYPLTIRTQRFRV